MNGFKILRSGIYSLLQDGGRFGQHQTGLTTGGPLDPLAFHWANRLCENPLNAAAVEITLGGLVLEALSDTRISLTGADIPLTINGVPKPLWQTHQVKAGDRIETGFSRRGTRGYLAVAGGILAQPVFGSVATVPRESLGGLKGDGSPLEKGDVLPCDEDPATNCWQLPANAHPYYGNEVTLRIIPGYQQQDFTREQQRLFFSSTYKVTPQNDRMGFRLQGPAIVPPTQGLLSEGICLGAVQIPPDGQPIVLLNDRQTIGGYPKIGAVLSLDIGKLAQLNQGSRVSFKPISIDQAHKLLHAQEKQFALTGLERVS